MGDKVAARQAAVAAGVPIVKPRHIEVQIMGDCTCAAHFFERGCSLQRRRPKLWKEAGADILPAATRRRLCETAVARAEAVNHGGTGTLEYLHDAASAAFFFIEMNTCI